MDAGDPPGKVPAANWADTSIGAEHGPIAPHRRGDVTGPTTSEEALRAASRALGRVRDVRAKGIPFDPLSEIASLRAALAGEGSELGLVTAAELEVSCTRVELAWAELDMRRAAIAFQVLTLGRHREKTFPSLVTAEEFLQAWNTPFADVLTVESRVWLARRLEVRLSEEVASVTDAAPSVPAGRPVETSQAGTALTGSGSAEQGEPEVPPGSKKTPLFPIQNWIRSPSGITFLLLATLLLAGAYDRLHALGALSLWVDEAQSTLISFTILQHGYPIIHSPHLINNFEPLYPYFEAASVVVLGHSNFAYRLPAALFGISLIPVSYYVGSRLRDRYVGIALAVMTTFSTELIGWSRQARWYILLVLLMALSLLVVTAWTRTTAHRRRVGLFLALLTLVILSAATSAGLFLLYAPAILAGGLVYFVVVRWVEIQRFFGAHALDGDLGPAPRFVPYWLRQFLAILLPATAILVVLADPGLVGRILGTILTRAVGFTPYPLVWSSNFGVYLVQYYLGVLVLVAVGAIAILWRRRPLELALLTFCGASFASVSSLASLTNDIASSSTSFERHIVPLLFFLFLVAAMAIVELLRLVWGWTSQLRWRLPRFSSARPLAFGLFVAILLIVPGVVAPSGVYDHPKPGEYPGGNLVAWDPFSLSPPQPSALYQAEQANYQLAADYVAAHRVAGEVVGATNPGPPAVYLGNVEYWIRGNAPNTSVILVDGRPAFFQTGSLLVANTSQLENVLFNTSGWLISDDPACRGPPFAAGMNLVVSYLMTNVTGGSDNTESLHHWNQTSPEGVLVSLSLAVPLLAKFGGNLAEIDSWAATNGVTFSDDRDFLLPIEGYLVAHANKTALPLAVLFNVYNDRTDLQNLFPDLLTGPGNNTLLIQWAYEVTSGIKHDSAYSELLPYASYYRSHA